MVTNFVRKWLVCLLLSNGLLVCGMCTSIFFYSSNSGRATCTPRLGNEEDDEDSCELPQNEASSCENCAGTPEPHLTRSGKLYVLDKPIWYDSAYGPDFKLFLKYEPNYYRLPYRNIGRHWSCSYISLGLQEKPNGNMWFYYGNGKATCFVYTNSVWVETLANENYWLGLQGKPKDGNTFWQDPSQSNAVVTFSGSEHYGFELKSNDFRLAWIGDEAGDRMTFHYTNDTTKLFDYVVMADSRKFRFTYLGATDDASYVPLESVEGPFAVVDEEDVEIPGVTRKILLTYMRQMQHSADWLLESITDMAGRKYQYTYQFIDRTVMGVGNLDFIIRSLTGPEGETTYVKLLDYGKQLRMVYPDQTWETVKFTFENNNAYNTKYWNSDRGSLVNPIEKKSFVLGSTMWMNDETVGRVDGAGLRIIKNRLSSWGVGDGFTSSRPYLSRAVYRILRSDADTDEVLGMTRYRYYEDSNQLTVAQVDLTDLYQKWGYIYEEEKFDADGERISTLTTEDLQTDAQGSFLGGREILKNADGVLLSEKKSFSRKQEWCPAKVAQWPGGFPLTNSIIITNTAQKVNTTDWQEKVFVFDVSGRLITESVRIENTGDPSVDFQLSTYRTYYATGDDNGRLKEVWSPGAVALEIGNITNASPNYSGLNKTAYEYDYAGRITRTAHTYYQTHTQLQTETIDFEYDALNHVIAKNYADGTSEYWKYSCCGISAYTDRDGNVTLYDRDSRRRVVRETKMSPVGTKLYEMSYKYDVDGNIIEQMDAMKAVTSYQYDNADRLIRVNEPQGVQTEYGYDLDGHQIYERYPNGLILRTFYDARGQVEHEAYYADESSAMLSIPDTTLADTVPLTADDGQPIIYSYQYMINGLLTHEYGPYKHSTTTPYAYSTNDWSKRYEYDLLGRQLATYTDDGAGGFYERNEFDLEGRLTKQLGPIRVGQAETVADVRQENIYDPQGLLQYEALESYIETTNTTVKKRNIKHYVQDRLRGLVQATSLAVMDAGEDVSLSNVGALDYTVLEQKQYDMQGRITSYTRDGLTQTSSYQMVDHYLTVTTSYQDGSISIMKIDGDRLVRAQDRNGVVAEYEFDAKGRQTVKRSERLGTDGNPIEETTTYDLLGNRTEQVNGAGERTRYTYNRMKQVVELTRPDNSTVFYEYDLLGNQIAVRGDSPEPATYRYDANANRISLTDGNGAVTHWYYDLLGRALKKSYAGHDEATADLTYTYDMMGNTISRTDANGVTTRYWYDNMVRLCGSDYPDPAQFANLEAFLTAPTTEGMDVRMAYDRYRRIVQIEDASGITVYSYTNLSMIVSSEDGPSGFLQRRIQDGKISKLFLGPLEVAASYLVNYSYDAERLASVEGGNLRTSYNYLTNSHLLQSIISDAGSVTQLMAHYQYDDMGRVLSLTNQGANGTVSSFVYELNELGQRVACEYENGDTLQCIYDQAGQLASIDGDGNLDGYDRSYLYDRSGNLLKTRTDSLTIESRFNTWNQMTNRQWSGTVDYLGSVAAADGRSLTEILVDGVSVAITGDVTDVTGSKIHKGVDLRVLALAEDSTGKKSSSELTTKGNENLTYDANGNLQQDGEYTYGWDYENRLIAVTPWVTNENSSRVEYVYDALGRRTKKDVYEWSTNQWVKTTETAFLYDKWNLIQEVITDFQHVPNAVITNQYVWGLDLSGTMHGLGGIGGLLSMSYGATTTACFYAYDANGNVCNLIDISDGSMVADYEYMPYGILISATGTLAEANPFRFSTKYYEPIGENYWYGYRFYSPTQATWLNRDPIAENGGLNVYAFVQNDPQNRVDSLGLFNINFGVHGMPSGIDLPFREPELSKGCCDGEEYYKKTQCCENKKVVNKTSYWVCRGRLMGDADFKDVITFFMAYRPGPLPEGYFDAFSGDFGSLGWFMPYFPRIPFLRVISHTYIVCQNPATTKNPKAYGKHPFPFALNPGGLSTLFGPGWINEEINRDVSMAHCEEKAICPKKWRSKCTRAGPAQTKYNIFYTNCHEWGDE